MARVGGERGATCPEYFVCYSRVQRDLAQRIEAKLAARVRRVELSVWRDVRNLDVWAELTPEIQAVLARVSGAIVVVSDDWYASDYIQEHEWPTIVAREAGDPSFGIFPVAVHGLDDDDPLGERNLVNDPRDATAHVGGRMLRRHRLERNKARVRSRRPLGRDRQTPAHAHSRPVVEPTCQRSTHKGVADNEALGSTERGPFNPAKPVAAPSTTARPAPADTAFAHRRAN